MSAGQADGGDAYAVNTVPQQRYEHLKQYQMKPGQTLNPNGRPKGSRNKLGEEFLADALAAWKKFGRTALERMAQAEPAKFCTMISGLLPKNSDVATDDWSPDLTSDERDSMIAELRARLRGA